MDFEYVISSLDLDRLETLIASAPVSVQKNTSVLQAKLANATIVEPEAMPGDVVTMNSIIEFKLSHTDEVFRLALVYPREMSETLSTLSVLAPIGTALLGSRSGMRVPFDSIDGTVTWIEVQHIRYQPEHQKEFHR